ncbi:DNA-binding transcriptional regulator, ArsR family [Salinibacillus kushneri]|uniref:DNA-binding transcriptional regulator, ArsR family n=1 Tax=Salinibacillus kushneri TaxID=237682 RepID=A0A1I0ILW3_9BACI|nr:metalloregulator ArsR/SmtB family transcription factor [Salinibacillus kushneri]SET98057.1 DNA-binding transcriptional regulator, ArsR family [Salinibacillus kushneri]
MGTDNMSKVFQALSHPIRRTIIDLLSKQPLTTGELCEQFDVSRYAVMKHLTILESAQVVLTRKNGREKINYFHAVPLQEVYRRWMNQFQADDASSMINLKHLFKKKESDDCMTRIQENNSFHIVQEICIQAGREKVFQALTKDINKWWSIRLFDQSELVAESKLGGKFYETSAEGKEALWGTLNLIKSNEELHYNGALGMPGAVNSYYIYKLKEDRPNETILQLDHTAFGMIDSSWEEDYEEGWNRLLHDLKHFIE